MAEGLENPEKSTLNLNCRLCGAEYRQAVDDLAEVVNGVPVVFVNTPVMRCEQCGDVVLTPDVVQAIETARADARPDGTCRADVYDVGRRIETSRSNDDSGVPAVSPG